MGGAPTRDASAAGNNGGMSGAGGATSTGSDGSAQGGAGIGGALEDAGNSGMGGARGLGGTTGSGGTPGLGGATGTGGMSGTGGTTAPPNLYATSAAVVEVFVNGVAIGTSTVTGALFSAAVTLNRGAENIIAIRASKGSAANPYLHAQMNGTFGKAGTSTRWKAKAAATADELTGSAWAATGFNDATWAAAKDVNVSPTASVMTAGPAHGIWTSSAADATAIFRMRFYIPAGWSAATPVGFGSAVTGGLGGTVINVTTAAQLAAAVVGNAAKIIQVAGTIDFTGSEGSTTASGCALGTCGSEFILGALGGCTGLPTFNITYDTAGTTPLSVGSNTTIIGIGPNATIKGKGFLFGTGANNIIIRNLTITSINAQVVWGGDALSFTGARNVWIDHNRISLIGRQFVVTHFSPNTNITLSYNDFDGNTPYSATCNGAHYWVMLILGTGDTITALGNWIHQTSGRGPHAGGAVGAVVNMQFVNDYYMTVPGHAVDPAPTANLLYEGTYFQDVTTPFIATDGGSSYAPVATTLGSTTAACTSAIGRGCVANATNSSTATTFPLDSAALTSMAPFRASMVAPYPAAEVPNSVPHLAGPGHF